MDSLTPSNRSKLMSKDRGRNTRPEIAVPRNAHVMGHRFRLHRSNLPGKADVVIPGFKTALFDHGCFLHCHLECRKSSVPKSDTVLWTSKFEKNVERDEVDLGKLETLGLRVGTIWKCEARNEDATRERLREILELEEIGYDG